MVSKYLHCQLYSVKLHTRFWSSDETCTWNIFEKISLKRVDYIYYPDRGSLTDKVTWGYVLLLGNPRASDLYNIQLDKLHPKIIFFFFTSSPYNQEGCTDSCTEKFRAGTEVKEESVGKHNLLKKMHLSVGCCAHICRIAVLALILTG